MIRIHDIKLKIGEPTDRLPAKVERKLRLPAGTVEAVSIARRSLDAREKPQLYYVYSLDIESRKSDGSLIEACKRTNTRWSVEKGVRFDIRPLERHTDEGGEVGSGSCYDTDVIGPRPVVVGFGPCGMFSALALAKYGLKPLVLERGGCMDERIAAVERFWNGGPLDPDCNVQFGEGGAGTFSDGKLTTGTKSPYSQWILERFVDAGASPEILYLQKPHIGTDVLRQVVVNIRKEIEALGGEVRFGCRLESVEIESGKVRSVRMQKDGNIEVVAADTVVLALGHSARDTVRQLYGQGLRMEQKPFSIGVRIEHPQSLIDMTQFGATHEELGIGPADYKLNVKVGDRYDSRQTGSAMRGVYTFCMCPGGYVINSSSEPGMLVTNGMSNSNRGSGIANSGLLADVLPTDYAPQYLPEGTDPTHPLAGMAFQEKYERLAFELGGGNYHAPIQTVGDFLGQHSSDEATAAQYDPSAGTDTVQDDPTAATGTASPSKLAPTFRPGTTPADLSKCLPDFAADAIRQAIPLLGRKLRGFDDPAAIMTGIESRSSSPVRIKRDPDTLQALLADDDGQIAGLYPAGEGAGYAGGIMSAAADGVRIAEKIAKNISSANKKQ